ncbi:hypothetical protein RvY_13206 [Ramazzottius varieornatus]|uniref:Uncharacterized protein n=1 Tax=Ramazzottius varieornatus TaxID=947166 RepID=A0A1D1VM29_RAMVA|nr:hypothetical protein RvY_13206 [Ramazzottius varieornatus]
MDYWPLIFDGRFEVLRKQERQPADELPVDAFLRSCAFDQDKPYAETVLRSCKDDGSSRPTEATEVLKARGTLEFRPRGESHRKSLIFLFHEISCFPDILTGEAP